MSKLKEPQTLAKFVPNGPGVAYFEIVNPTLLNFDTLKLGHHETMQFAVANDSLVPATFTIGFYTNGFGNEPGSELSGHGLNVPVTLAPGTSYDFTVSFDGNHVGPLMTSGGANDFLSISPAPNVYFLAAITGNVVAPPYGHTI